MTLPRAVDFQTLLADLDADFPGLKALKVALIADGASQFLTQALRACGKRAGLDIEVLNIAYLGVERAAADPSCELYSFKPDFLIVCHCYQALRREFYDLPEGQKGGYAAAKMAGIEKLYAAVQDKCGSKVIVCTVPRLNDGVFGHFSSKVPVSLPHQIGELNYALAKLSTRLPGLFVCDVSALAQLYGFRAMHDAKLYVNADMNFTLDFLPVLGRYLAGIIAVADGRVKKCLIFDLDNTIWGGAIGDDGLDRIELGNLGLGKAYSEIQLFLRQLRARGIILAVCSKNEESVAKEPFEKHPDMALRLDDIAVFVANWNAKAENIRKIRETLNIDFDSMVFIDDNPAERDLVRRSIEGICVPDMPADVSEWVDYLAELNLFETASYSAEDRSRTAHYQQEAARTAVRDASSGESDFLSNLGMVCAVKALDGFTLPRVAQLTQRTNQFNVRRTRYTESDLTALRASRDRFCLSFALRDRFGDSGIVSAVVLRRAEDGSLFIDTWVMSCRVFQRTLEAFVLNRLAAFARSRGYRKIVGEYRPSPKNHLVADLYARLGFKKREPYWELDVDSFAGLETFITGDPENDKGTDSCGVGTDPGQDREKE